MSHNIWREDYVIKLSHYRQTLNFDNNIPLIHDPYWNE
jgi:hypothetical protein